MKNRGFFRGLRERDGFRAAVGSIIEDEEAGSGGLRSTPKGRRVDPKAQEEVRELLGDAPRRRDLLIEHLHKIQDRFGCLEARHLVALAAEMKLAMVKPA